MNLWCARSSKQLISYKLFLYSYKMHSQVFCGMKKANTILNYLVSNTNKFSIIVLCLNTEKIQKTEI